MKIRTSVTMVGLLLVASALAVVVSPFGSWDILTKKSEDIVIARCTATAEPLFIINGIIDSEIQVLMVLKGRSELGSSVMQSAYAPRQGDQFLMFANWHNNHPAQTYTATEKYRIVPLSRHFQTNDLVGKPLGEQIQLVLRQRLQELHRELQQGAVEKKRLEEGIKP